VFGGVGNLWGTLVGALSLGVVNKILEPVAGAVLEVESVLVCAFAVPIIDAPTAPPTTAPPISAALTTALRKLFIAASPVRGEHPISSGARSPCGSTLTTSGDAPASSPRTRHVCNNLVPVVGPPIGRAGVTLAAMDRTTAAASVAGVVRDTADRCRP